jgi:hypothetical protein
MTSSSPPVRGKRGRAVAAVRTPAEGPAGTLTKRRSAERPRTPRHRPGAPRNVEGSRGEVGRDEIEHARQAGERGRRDDNRCGSWG